MKFSTFIFSATPMVLFLLGSTGIGAFAAAAEEETTGGANEEEQGQRRKNALVRGAARTGANGMLHHGAGGGEIEELPEQQEDYLRRLLSPPFPPVEVGSGRCSLTGQDVFGCEKGYYAICYFHDDKVDHYHTKCYNAKDGPVTIGETLPGGGKGGNNQYVVACGPCQCFTKVQDEINKMSVTAKSSVLQQSKKKLADGFSDFDCSSLFVESEAPSSAPSDACLACDGGESFYFVNPIKASLNWHVVAAKLMGCELATIKSQAEQDAALSVTEEFTDIRGATLTEFTVVFLGAIQTGFQGNTFEFQWLDGTGEKFTGSASSQNTVDPYTNWLSPDPNGESELAVGLLIDTFDPNRRGKWVDVDVGRREIGLYKCCPPPDLDFAGCPVASLTSLAASSR